MVSAELVKERIKTGIPDAQIQVLTSDGDHFDVIVVSSTFTGKRLLQQHQLVKETISSEMLSGAIHALSIKTFTPEEWDVYTHSSGAIR